MVRSCQYNKYISVVVLVTESLLTSVTDIGINTIQNGNDGGNLTHSNGICNGTEHRFVTPEKCRAAVKSMLKELEDLKSGNDRGMESFRSFSNVKIFDLYRKRCFRNSIHEFDNEFSALK
jgi:hypothetical protein